MTLTVESKAGGVRFRVKVRARAKQEGIVEVYNQALYVRVTPPAVAGRANRALVKLLAERLHVPRSSIKIAAGERASLKLVEVVGLDAAAVLERLRLSRIGRAE